MRASFCALLLLILVTVAAALVDFPVRCHHAKLKKDRTRADAEKLVFDTLKSLLEDRITSLRITKVKEQKRNEKVFLFDAVLTVADGVKRDDLISTVHTDELVHGLRFMKVYKGQPHIAAPSSNFYMKDAPLFPMKASSKEDICNGNGVLLPNKTCVCDDFYIGKQCDDYYCAASGFIGIEGQCACPPGRFGDFCRPKTCSAPVSDNIDMSRRGLMFAISVKSTMARDLQQLVPIISDAVRSLNKAYPDTYDIFTLETFIDLPDGDWAFEWEEAETVEQFVNELEAIAISKGAEKQPILGAFYDGLYVSTEMHGHSTLFLFADSLPSDDEPWNPVEETDANHLEVPAIENMLAWGQKLVLFITDPPAAPINPEDPSMVSLRRIASVTHGDFIHTSKKQIGSIAKEMINDMHLNENLYIKSDYSCDSEVAVELQVHANAIEYKVYFTGSSTGKLYASPTLISQTPEQEITAALAVDNFMVFYVPANLLYIRMVGKGAKSPACSIRVGIMSDSIALISFSNDPTIDVGQATATQGVVHQLSLWSSVPGCTFNLEYSDRSGNVVEKDIIPTPRSDSCNFPYAATMKSTCTAGSYTMRVTATDESGALAYSRIIPVLCEMPVSHTPPDYVCLNNGTIVNNQTISCQCDSDLFVGDHCERPICLNGGSVNPFPIHGDDSSLCICPVGWSGVHCEMLTPCSSKADGKFDLAAKALTFVLQTSFSQAYVYDQITSALQGQANQFEHYQLVTFNRISKGGNATDQVTSGLYNSLSELQQALTEVKYQYATSSAQSSLSAMGDGLADIISSQIPGSLVFLITDSNDNSPAANVVVARQSLAQLNSPVHIIRTPSFDDGCTSLTGNETSTDFIAVSRQSGGVFVDICKDGYQIGDIAKIITSFIETSSRNQLVAALQNYGMDCSATNQSVVYNSAGDRLKRLRIHTESSNTVTITVHREKDGVVVQVTQLLLLPTVMEYELPMPDDLTTFINYRIEITFAKPGGCSVYVFGDSDDMLFLGFSNPGSTDLLRSTALYGTPMSPVMRVVTHFTGDQFPLNILSAYNGASTNVTYTSTKGRWRDQCTFEFRWLDQLSCTDYGKPFILTASIQEPSNTIDRVFFPFCSEPDNHCVHGSINNQTNGCDCQKGYSGPYCEYPTCQNGGTSDNGLCFCPAQYTGTFCEYVMCDALNVWSAKDPRSRDFRAVTFVMETTYNALAANTMLISNLKNIVIAFNWGGLAKQFSLITYDDTSVTVAVSQSIPLRFVAEVHTVMNTALYKTTSPNITKAFDAVDAAINLDVPSPHLVVALVSASSTPDFNTIRRFTEKRPGVQVNIIYTPYIGDSMLPGSSPYYLYDAVTLLSEGRVLPVSQSSVFDLKAVLTSWTDENTLIAVDGSSSCTTGFTTSFAVESSANILVIQIVGTGVDHSSTTVSNDKLGGIVAIVPYVKFEDSASMVIHINDLQLGGNWQVKTQTTKGKCLVQVRANTDLRTELGFTTDIHNDFVNVQPFTASATIPSSTTTHAVISVPRGYALQQHAAFNQIQLFDVDFSTNKFTFKQNISMTTRDPGVQPFGPNIACAYQYISDSFKFDTSYMAMRLSGVSALNGDHVQRTFVVASKQKLSCVNGKNIQTGECQCDAGFTGEACETTLCANGGTASGTICLCRSGFIGLHCENYINPIVPTTTAAPTTQAPTSSSPAASSMLTTMSASTYNTPEAETTTEGTTTTPTTTAPPPCYPDFAEYQILFMLEDGTIQQNTPPFGGSVAKALADINKLGQNSQTFYVFSGVNDRLTVTSKVSTKDKIDQAITDVENGFDMGTSNGKFDLGSALDKFLKGNDIKQFTDPVKFAVIISGMAATDNSSSNADALKKEGFTIIGISVFADADATMHSIADYTITSDQPNEAADFIKGVLCKLKPRAH